MKRLVGFYLILALTPLNGLSDDERKPMRDMPWIGFIRGDDPPQYLIINFDFGIEQWEGSKRTTRRHQVWKLKCSFPPYFPPPNQTECDLERTVVDRWNLQSEEKWIIAVKKHATHDGTLKIKKIDWAKGILGFTVISEDLGLGETEVLIRMKYERNYIYLDSFKAFAVARGLIGDSLTSIEYRIPEYEYTLELPLRMKGFKSAFRKRLDDVIDSLDDRDRRIWSKLEAGSQLLEFPDTETLRKILPNADQIDKGEQEIAPEDWKRLVEFVLGTDRERFLNAGMSDDAVKKLTAVLLTVFMEAGPHGKDSGEIK